MILSQVGTELLVLCLTNHFLNLGFLMQLLVNLENILDCWSFKEHMFPLARAQNNNSYFGPYTRYKTILSTDSIIALSCEVISVLQAGEAKWRTLSTCACRTFSKSCSLAPSDLSLRTTHILAQALLTSYLLCV